MLMGSFTSVMSYLLPLMIALDVDSRLYVISTLLLWKPLCARTIFAPLLGTLASMPVCSCLVFCSAAGTSGWKEAGVSVPRDFEPTPSYQRVWFAFTGYR